MIISLLVFLAGIFIKRKRWIILSLSVSIIILLPYFISLVSFQFYSWYFIRFLQSFSSPDKHGFYFVLIPVWSCLGLIGGALASLITKHYIPITIKKSVIILAIGYALVFCTGVLYEVISLRVHSSIGNPLSQRCIKSELHFSLGIVTINVPANPIMILHTGSNSLWTLYPSMFDWPMRELCKRAGKENEPYAITDIIFAFFLIDSQLKERSFNFSRLACDSNDDAGGKLLCEAAAYKATNPRRLTGIEIFQPQNFVPSISGPWHYRYEAFLEAKEAAAKAGTPWTATQSEIFDRYPDGYYVARDATLTDGGKNPITVHCKDSTTKDWLACTTVRALSNGLQGNVTFSTPAAELDQTAIAANQSASKLLTILSAPTQ